MAPNANRWVAIKPKVGNLSMSIKDAEDQLMQIFHRNGTELMENAPHLDPVVGVRVASETIQNRVLVNQSVWNGLQLGRSRILGFDMIQSIRTHEGLLLFPALQQS